MSNPLIQKVEEKVKSNPVVIFMKGTKEFPQCGFSAKACRVLEAAGAGNFVSIDLLADEPLWEALEEVTQWPTSPQVFIKGQFVGGCDIVTEMYERGELQKMIAG